MTLIYKNDLTPCHLQNIIISTITYMMIAERYSTSHLSMEIQVNSGQERDETMAIQQHNDDQKGLPGKRPRLMIDISPELRRRIKIAAVQKDLSIREYVEQILEEAVPPVLHEEASTQQQQPHPVSRESVERLLQAHEQMVQERQGRPSSDSTEIIRQMRQERSQYLAEL